MHAIVVNAFPLFQQALQSVIHQVAPGVEVFAARDVRTATSLLEQDAGIRLAILDLDLPELRGLDALHSFRTSFPALRTAVMADAHEGAMIEAARLGGSIGYISKTAPIEAVTASVRRILNGDKLAPIDSAPATTRLTGRQLDVLRLLMRGQPNKVVARELGMATGTVKIHVSAILRALQVGNRTEAVVMARRLGFDFARS